MAENEKKVTEEVAEKKEAKATKASKPAKKDKVSFGQKIKKAWKEFKAEFKKIVWSSKRNTFTNTVLVIVVMVVVATVIGVLDYGFSNLIKLLGGLV